MSCIVVLVCTTEQGVPYNVSVAAYTSVGMGSVASLTEFTVEGS